MSIRKGGKFKLWAIGALALFFVILVVCEIVLRCLFGLANSPLVVEHPKLEYMMRPNQRLIRFGNRIEINRFGMRSPDFGEKKLENEFRVMVLGDSVINGGAPTDQADLATEHFCRYLETVLSPAKVSVGNISAGSWGPENLLAYVKEFGLFDADLVYIVLSSHDLYDRPTFAPLNPVTHPTQNYSFAISEFICRYLLSQSTRSEVRQAVASKEGSSGSHLGRENTLQQLGELIGTIKNLGVPVVVFLHPQRDEMLAGKFGLSGVQIMDFCKKLDVVTVDLIPIYGAEGQDGVGIFRDFIHLNSRGQLRLFTGFVLSIPEGIGRSESFPGLGEQ